MRPIRGAGGGKGGGGGSRAPVEARDSLRSVAYARVLDLIGEGEIEGLVDGAKSIYMDGTPLQDASGAFNFAGAKYEARNGSQGQSYLPGFPAVESEQSVGIEVTSIAPVVRTLTNPNLTAVRVTVGVPTLSNTNTSTGDVSGTSVQLAVDVQSNGGGYVTQFLGREWSDVGVSQSGLTVSTVSNRTGIRFSLSAPDALSPSSVLAVRIEYRAIGAGAWTLFENRTMPPNPNLADEGLYDPPTVTDIQITGLSPLVGGYEARVVKTGGTGTPVVSDPQALATSSRMTISGKSSSRYQRSYRIELAGPPPWDIRVRRLTADSTNQYLQNKTFWDSYTEIIDSKLRYPNSALVGLQIDSSQFQGIPTRGYDVKLLRVKVPVNYDPVTRVYTGSWNGTFKIAWTDNPAWCFYDLLTNQRYGLGAFIPEAQVDKWTLYTIAQYCDQLVPDGFGGQEPRFTCNLYLQTRADAYRVVNDMASIFRAMVFWSSGAITASQDSPSDAAYLYTPANVIDGLFTYSGSSAKVRHTVALVAWNDPADLYRQKVEYVEDAAGIARFGVVQTEITAVGCTSRGQAHRAGKWLLLSERLESDVVSFKVGLDGALARPGQIIKVADPARAGVRLGGRIVSATTTGVTLDAPVTLAPATTYTLAVVSANGGVLERTVTTGAGTVSAVSVSPALPAAPEAQAIWILSSDTVQAQLFRVVAVTEDDKHQFSISALAHEPDKYNAIEQGLALEPRSISVLTARPASPKNGQLQEELYEAGVTVKTRVTLSCDAVPGATSYVFGYRIDSGNFVELAPSAVPLVRIDDAQTGAYAVSVAAVSSLGYRGPATTFGATVLGRLAPPSDVTNLQVQVQSGGGLLTWDAVRDLDVRLGGKILVRHSTELFGAQWSAALPLAEFPGGSASGAIPLLSGTYLVKAEDSSGVQSVNAISVSTTAPALQQFNAIAFQQEDTAFTGIKTRMEVSSGVLLLASSVIWDAIADLDAFTNAIDSGIEESGEYEFSAPVDVGAVYPCRVTADVGVLSYDVSNVADLWTSVDALTSIDGLIANDSASVELFISTTDDDPAGAPLWSPWRLFVVGDYKARAFRFRLAVARGPSPSQQVSIRRLRVTVDAPDRVEGVNNVAVPAAGLTVSFAAPFFAVPAVAVTSQNMATGDYYEITAKTTAGFTIQFRNSAGTGIARTMDWIAKGYGYRT